MPLYDYECESCGQQKERFFWLAERKRSLKCDCGGRMKTIITTRAKPEVVDEWDEVLNARVTGPKHRRQLMRRHPLALEEL